MSMLHKIQPQSSLFHEPFLVFKAVSPFSRGGNSPENPNNKAKIEIKALEEKRKQLNLQNFLDRNDREITSSVVLLLERTDIRKTALLKKQTISDKELESYKNSLQIIDFLQKLNSKQAKKFTDLEIDRVTYLMINNEFDQQKTEERLARFRRLAGDAIKEAQSDIRIKHHEKRQELNETLDKTLNPNDRLDARINAMRSFFKGFQTRGTDHAASYMDQKTAKLYGEGFLGLLQILKNANEQSRKHSEAYPAEKLANLVTALEKQKAYFANLNLAMTFDADFKNPGIDKLYTDFFNKHLGIIAAAKSNGQLPNIHDINPITRDFAKLEEQKARILDEQTSAKPKAVQTKKDKAKEVKAKKQTTSTIDSPRGGYSEEPSSKKAPATPAVLQETPVAMRDFSNRLKLKLQTPLGAERAKSYAESFKFYLRVLTGSIKTNSINDGVFDKRAVNQLQNALQRLKTYLEGVINNQVKLDKFKTTGHDSWRENVLEPAFLVNSELAKENFTDQDLLRYARRLNSVFKDSYRQQEPTKVQATKRGKKLEETSPKTTSSSRGATTKPSVTPAPSIDSSAPDLNYNKLRNDWTKEANSRELTSISASIKQKAEAAQINPETAFTKRENLDADISAMKPADWDKHHFHIEGLNHAVGLLNGHPFTLRSYKGLQKFLTGKTAISVGDLDKAFTALSLNYHSPDGKKTTKTTTAAEAYRLMNEQFKRFTSAINATNNEQEKIKLITANDKHWSGNLELIKHTIHHLQTAQAAITSLQVKIPGQKTAYDLLAQTLSGEDRKHKVVLDDGKTNEVDRFFDQSNNAAVLPQGTNRPDEFRKLNLMVSKKAQDSIAKTFPGFNPDLITALTLQLYKPQELAQMKTGSEWCLKVSDDKQGNFVFNALPQAMIDQAAAIKTALGQNKNALKNKGDLYALIVKFGSPERRIEAHAAHMVNSEDLGAKKLDQNRHLNWADILERNKAEFRDQFNTVSAERGAYLRILQRVQDIEDPKAKAEAFKAQLNEFILRGVQYYHKGLDYQQIQNLYNARKVTDLDQPLKEADKSGSTISQRDYLRAGYMIDNSIRETYRRLEKAATPNAPKGLLQLQSQLEGILSAQGLRLKPEAQTQILKALWEKMSGGIGLQAVAGSGFGVGGGVSIPVKIGGQTFNVYAGLKVDTGRGLSGDVGAATTFNLNKRLDLTISAGLFQRSAGLTAKLPEAINLSLGVHELTGAFGVSVGVGFRMEEIIETQKINKLKSMNLHEIHWLMSKNPSAEFQKQTYDEIKKHKTFGGELAKKIQESEGGLKRSLSTTEKEQLAWRLFSLPLAAEKARQNPKLKDYVAAETVKLEKEFQSKGLTLNEQSKNAFALRLSQAYIALMSNENQHEAKLPPITGLGIMFITPPGLPVPYVGIVTGRKTVVVPFVSSDIARNDLENQIQNQIQAQLQRGKGQGGALYEVQQSIDLGSAAALTRDPVFGLSKLDRQGLAKYASFGTDVLFDSTKAYNEKLAGLGLNLSESSEQHHQGLLEIKVKNAGERLTVHLDDTLRDKVRLVYEGTRVFLAIKNGTPLFMNREDLSYSFRKDGAFTHTELTIKSNPEVKNRLIRENTNGFYLTRRTRVVHDSGQSAGAILQEDWAKMAYRGKAAKADNGAIMDTLQRQFALNGTPSQQKDLNQPSYRRETLSLASYKQPAQELLQAISIESGSIDPQRIKTLQTLADRFAETPEYKKFSTLAFGKNSAAAEVDLARLTRSILIFGTEQKILASKGYSNPSLNPAESQFILMRLLHTSFVNLQKRWPHERDARWQRIFEKFSLPLVETIFHSRLKAMGKSEEEAKKLATEFRNMIADKMHNVQLSSDGEVIGKGSLFASLVGTKNTDGSWITGLRVSDNFGGTANAANPIGEHALRLLNKTNYSLQSTNPKEKMLAQLILDTLSPVPKENFELLRSPLALKLAPFIGFSYGPEGMRTLAKIMRAENAKDLKTLSSQEKDLLNRFLSDVRTARASQLNGKKTWILPLPNLKGAQLEISLGEVNVAAGLYKRCGNISFVANEKISARLIVNRSIIAGGGKGRAESYVGAELKTQLRVLGIAVMVGDVRRPEKKPPETPQETPKKTPDNPERRNTVHTDQKQDKDVPKNQAEEPSPQQNQSPSTPPPEYF